MQRQFDPQVETCNIRIILPHTDNVPVRYFMLSASERARIVGLASF